MRQVYGGTARWKRLLQRPLRTATEAKFNDVVTMLKEQMQAAWALQGSQPQAPCAPASSAYKGWRACGSGSAGSAGIAQLQGCCADAASPHGDMSAALCAVVSQDMHHDGMCSCAS